MKWPLVSRRAYDTLKEQGDARVEDYRKTLESEREHNRYLTGELLNMKRDGFEPTAAPVIPEPTTPPAIIMRAIQIVSPVQDAAYKMNYEYAMSFKDQWNDAAAMKKLADQILHGAAKNNYDEPSEA